MSSVSQQLLQLQIEAQEAINLQNQKQAQKEQLQSTLQSAYLSLNAKYEQLQAEEEQKKRIGQSIVSEWNVGKETVMEEERKRQSELEAWKKKWDQKQFCK